MAKKNMTVRIDDEMREKLQLVADREMRPLANQMLYFLSQGLDEYLAQNQLTYVHDEGKLMTTEELRRWREDQHLQKSAQSDSDVPF